MAIVKLPCGTEYKVNSSFTKKEDGIYIDGVHISKVEPIGKTCKCSLKCK